MERSWHLWFNEFQIYQISNEAMGLRVSMEFEFSMLFRKVCFHVRDHPMLSCVYLYIYIYTYICIFSSLIFTSLHFSSLPFYYKSRKLNLCSHLVNEVCNNG